VFLQDHTHTAPSAAAGSLHIFKVFQQRIFYRLHVEDLTVINILGECL